MTQVICFEKTPSYEDLAVAFKQASEELERLNGVNNFLQDTIKDLIKGDLQAYEYRGFLVTFENGTVNVARKDGMRVDIFFANEVKCSIPSPRENAEFGF